MDLSNCCGLVDVSYFPHVQILRICCSLSSPTNPQQIEVILEVEPNPAAEGVVPCPLHTGSRWRAELAAVVLEAGGE